MKWREHVFGEVFRNLVPDEKFDMVLDVGGGQSEVEKLLKPKKYMNANKRIYSGESDQQIDEKATPDIDCDLNKIQKFPLKSGSCDLVVLSQILEHLNFDAQWRIAKESKRLSRRYIIVGLPNDLVYYQRARMMLGDSVIGVSEFGHHYLFNIPLADKFVKERFSPEFKVVKRYGVTRGPLKKMPGIDLLKRLNENVFVSEIYYLLERKKR